MVLARGGGGRWGSTRGPARETAPRLGGRRGADGDVNRRTGQNGAATGVTVLGLIIVIGGGVVPAPGLGIGWAPGFGAGTVSGGGWVPGIMPGAGVTVAP